MRPLHPPSINPVINISIPNFKPQEPNKREIRFQSFGRPVSPLSDSYFTPDADRGEMESKFDG